MSEYQKINEYIKDFLKYNGYSSTLECLEAEERMMKVTSKTKQSIKAPSDVSIFFTYLSKLGKRSQDVPSFRRRGPNQPKGVEI